MAGNGDAATRALLVVHPSDDYAGRVRRHCANAVMVATPERAALLSAHPNVVGTDLGAIPRATSDALRFLRERNLQPGGITCFVCEYLPATALLARELDLPFHSEAAILTSRRKDLAFRAWKAAGVATPETESVGSLAELRAFARRVRGPWILKPTSGTGSSWVLKAVSESELERAHREIREGVASTGETTYLAQEMAAGTEVSVDLFVDGTTSRLLRLTEKCLATAGGTAGVVQAYYPSRRPRRVREQIAAACHSGAKALGVERGIVMADVILGTDGPVLLEMGLRPGGDCLPDMSIHATGYDPVGAAVRTALGLDPGDSRLDGPEPVAALHLMGRQTGRISSIDFGALEADPRVLHFEPYHGVGDELRVWQGSYDDRILAACVVRCEDPRELPALAEELAEKVRVSVDLPPRDEGLEAGRGD